MAAYNTVDGIPCHVNRHVLRDILRDELGFDGIVLSDGWGVKRAISQMGYAEERGAAEVLRAGVDLSLADDGAFLNLISACEKGYVDEDRIDNSVLRILEKKFEVGLFDNPYKEENDSLTAYIGSGEQKRLSYEAASESIVLLKNNGILPLSPKKRVALFGCHAEDVYYLLGDYTPIQNADDHDTILDTFKRGFTSVEYTRGWDFCGDSSDIEHAIKLARSCDVAIVTVGGSSARYLADTVLDSKTGAAIGSDGFLDCGEGCDVSDIALPGNQTELIRRLKAAGIPVISLMIAGRPYQITEADECSDAVLSAWYPGHQGAEAIYDVIIGKVNPSGKLSVSIPYASTCLPAYYNRYGKTVEQAKRKAYNGTYYDHLTPVLYPFGYGLSYSSFAYSDLKITSIAKNKFKIVVTVENTSNVGGKEVVQLYIRGSGNSVRRRSRELKGFKKLYLEPHEKKTVSFMLGYDELKVYSVNNKYEVEDASVTVMIGSNPYLPLSAEIQTEAELRT
jgi:beta-glucosidase